WKWELSYNYGRTDATQRIEGEYITSRLRNAIGPSFIDPSNGPTCGTPSSPIFGCVPMNLLGGAGAISAAARDYAGFTGVEIGDTKQQTAVATAHGRIARLPGGGDIALAVTADFRRDSGNFTPDALIASGDTPANNPPAAHGEDQVFEAAAELAIVPIRDRDGTERLEIDLAARAFRYDSFDTGAVTSVRALVRPIRAITLRASRSGSFRAPTVTELFQNRVVDFPGGTDPCDAAFGPLAPQTAAECAREGVPANAMFGTTQQRAATAGNEFVQPETAIVTSAGAVLELPRRTGLSLSVDWWSVELTSAIQAPLIQTVFTNCYQRGIRSSCDLIHRKSSLGGAIDFVDLSFANLGGSSTSGVDAAINFDHRAPGLGDLHARLELQTLNSFDVDTGGGTVLHGLGNFDLGVHPVRKLEASAQWHNPGGLSAGFVFHFIDSFQECDGDNCQDPTSPSRTVDSYSKLDVFSTIALGRGLGDVVLTLGINNVLDQAPPTIYNSVAGNYDPATYDLLGRFAYARLTQTF
ncbi:MAG TPA: TonB-dependent receptor, partial [Kofleriaceae bacterium]|nr:TonB-dependent receptor [Kofleriaceae bacterium]